MASTPGLTLGPLDPDSSSALTSKLGVHNKAKKLIERHAANIPLALTIALGRPRDDLRSEAILEHMDEVESALRNIGGRRAFFKEGDVLEDASVRESGEGRGKFNVSVVFRKPSGRSAVGVIPYLGFDTVERTYEELKAKVDGVAPAAAAPAGDVDTTVLQARADEADRLEAAARQAEEERNTATAQLQELTERLERLENPEPWEGYDDANATDVVKRIQDGGATEFGTAGLERILTYEAAGKDRSTVTDAVEHALATAAAPPAE